MSDTVAKLGKLIEGDEQRDAIHIAVAPVMAAEKLFPGERIGLVSEGVAGTSGEMIGIVDPFLRQPVMKGEKFWMFLNPGSITSLLHVWTHPAFAAVEGKTKRTSEEWLRNFAKTHDCPEYEVLIAAASGEKLPDLEYYGTAYTTDGEYLHFNGRDAHGDIPDEFWVHLENLTGKKISERPKYFSCSC